MQVNRLPFSLVGEKFERIILFAVFGNERKLISAIQHLKAPSLGQHRSPFRDVFLHWYPPKLALFYQNFPALIFNATVPILMTNKTFIADTAKKIIVPMATLEQCVRRFFVKKSDYPLSQPFFVVFKIVERTFLQKAFTSLVHPSSTIN